MPGRKPIEFDGARDLWEKTADPRWVWRAIRDRIHHHEPLPDWVLDYLDKCAIGIENARGDFGRGLHRILGFGGSSKGPKRNAARKGPKRDPALDLRDERFVMAFVREIWRGVSPGTALGTASAEVDGPGGKDEKELRNRLKVFFDLKPLPRQAWKWKVITATWLVSHPGYSERYPDLPTEFRFKDSSRG
jgi:hypothetical protein